MNLTKEFNFGPLRGRGLVATRRIEAGEILFEEIPLLSCQFAWNKLYGYLACDHCLKPLEDTQTNVSRLSNQTNLLLSYPEASYVCPSIYNCPTCSTTRYCSEKCYHTASRQYHAVMCLNDKIVGEGDNPLVRLDEIWRNFHFPPETCTIFLLVRLVSVYLSAYILDEPESMTIVNSLNTFLSNTAEYVENEKLCHNLLGEQFVSQLDEIHKAFIDVVHYLFGKLTTNKMNSAVDEKQQIFNQQPVLQGLLEKEVFLNLLCLIGRNGQGIATSSFKLWLDKAQMIAKDCGKEDEFGVLSDKLYDAMDAHVSCSFLDNEGVGLYKYQSLINHSCSPNAVVKFSGLNATLTIEALEYIGENEEITISYLDPCIQSRSRHSRRQHLAAHYLFWCECRLCIQDKLDGALSETSDEDESDTDVEAMEED